MKIDWKSIKKFIDNTGLHSYINYIELETGFYIWIQYQGENFSTLILKNSIEYESFVKDYKSKAILKNDLSNDGLTYVRSVYVGKKRMLHCLFTCLTTSEIITNDTSGLITCRIRDINRQITNDSQEAMYTEIDFCPGAVTYGLHGGGVENLDPLDREITVNAILAPEIPENLGGSIYFVKNKILKTPHDSVLRQAVNVGEIEYVCPGSNVVRIEIKHPVGIKRKIQTEIQYYI